MIPKNSGCVHTGTPGQEKAWVFLSFYTMIQEKLLDPRVFKLLMRIKYEIQPPESIGSMSKIELVEYIVDQIIEVGDSLNTPIFRVKLGLVIYENNKPLELRKKGFQEFLACKSS